MDTFIIFHNCRPTSTRGRGSAHYSTLGGNDASQPAPNRGTPPTLELQENIDRAFKYFVLIFYSCNATF